MNRVTRGKLDETSRDIVQELRTARLPAATDGTSSDSTGTPAPSPPSHATLQTELVNVVFEYAVRLPLYRRILAIFCVSLDTEVRAFTPMLDTPGPTFLEELAEHGGAHLESLFEETGVRCDACSTSPRFRRMHAVTHFMSELCVAGCVSGASIISWCGALIDSSVKADPGPRRNLVVETVLTVLRTTGPVLDTEDAGWGDFFSDFCVSLKLMCDPRIVGGVDDDVEEEESVVHKGGGDGALLDTRMSFLVLELLELKERSWQGRGRGAGAPLYVA